LKSQTAALISHGAISKLVTDGTCWDQARPPPTYFPIGRYLDPLGRRFLSPAETWFTILSPYLSQFWICLSCDDDDEQDVQTLFLPEKKNSNAVRRSKKKKNKNKTRNEREREMAKHGDIFISISTPASLSKPHLPPENSWKKASFFLLLPAIEPFDKSKRQSTKARGKELREPVLPPPPLLLDAISFPIRSLKVLSLRRFFKSSPPFFQLSLLIWIDVREEVVVASLVVCGVIQFLLLYSFPFFLNKKKEQISRWSSPCQEHTNGRVRNYRHYQTHGWRK